MFPYFFNKEAQKIIFCINLVEHISYEPFLNLFCRNLLHLISTFPYVVAAQLLLCSKVKHRSKDLNGFSPCSKLYYSNHSMRYCNCMFKNSIEQCIYIIWCISSNLIDTWKTCFQNFPGHL